jgi:hypothetical protein
VKIKLVLNSVAIDLEKENNIWNSTYGYRGGMMYYQERFDGENSTIFGSYNAGHGLISFSQAELLPYI